MQEVCSAVDPPPHSIGTVLTISRLCRYLLVGRLARMQVLPESGRNTSVDVPAESFPPATKIPEIVVSLWPHHLKNFCFLNQGNQ